MNTVSFDADPAQMKKLEMLFSEMARLEHSTMHGQLPEFVSGDHGYLFNLEWEAGLLCYDTKWAPNTSVILEIALRFGVDFSHDYYEPAMGIYGEGVYESGVLRVFDLDEAEFNSFEYMEDSDTYIFEGGHYSVMEEILDILIFRKKLAAGITN